MAPWMWFDVKGVFKILTGIRKRLSEMRGKAKHRIDGPARILL
jgi:hypothetical protein